MSIRRIWLVSRGTALVAVLALTQNHCVQAQDAVGLPGRPRSVNERVVIESPAVPSATGDAARINAQQNPVQNPYMGGRDLAIMVEHAVGMAIEGSSLRAIAGPASAGTNDIDDVKRLRMQAKKLMVESQTLLGQAAADTRGLGGNPSVSQFHAAANLYIATLATLEPAGPSEIAQVGLINHAVKDVLEADHIRQMAPSASGNPAIEQLRNHAALMKEQGSTLLRSLADQASPASGGPPTVVTLADRGRQLIVAAEQVSRSVGISSATAGPIGRPDEQPAIIGGTYGNGSPRLGTYKNLGQPPGSTLPKAQSEPSPVPNNSNQTTGSTGGLPPR